MDDKLFGILPNTRFVRVVLGLALPLLLVIVYLLISNERIAENPHERITPAVSAMLKQIYQAAFVENIKSGDYILWTDMLISLKRISMGLGLAALVGLLLGLHIGMSKGIKALLQPIIQFLAVVPPLAILPILMIVVGIDEAGKITLIFIGCMFVIAIDIFQTIEKLPQEQIVKAKSLGASNAQIAYLLVLPQIIPRLLEVVLLSLGAAWLFLLAAEMISADAGFGYRIFVAQRMMRMSLIIPYVLILTAVGVLVKIILLLLLKLFPWYSIKR